MIMWFFKIFFIVDVILFYSFYLFHFTSLHLTLLFLTVAHDMQDFSSLTKDQTCAPCNGSTES